MKGAFPTRISFGSALLLLSLAVLWAPVPAGGAGARSGQAGTPVAEPAQPVPLLKVPFPQEDGSLTPYTFELAYPLVTLVYDTLLWRDAQGVPQPWLATAVETSTDQRRVTIRLAPNVSWHDGVPLTSADVVFTFRFVADRLHTRFSPQLDAVERVDAPDPSTVVMTLRYTSPGFSDQPLADLPILPGHIWRRLPAGQLAPEGLPIGSGPYRLVEHRPDQSYRFEANDGYFRGPPAVRTIEVPIIADFAETLRAIEQGRIDMVPLNLGKDAAARIAGATTRVARGASYVGTTLMFNLRQAPFDRPEARMAVAQAIDVVRTARAAGGPLPARRGHLHPESPWAPPEDLAAAGSTRPGVAPPPAAIPAPFELLVADNDPTKLAAAQHIMISLRRAGFEMSVKRVRPAELSKAVGEDGSPPSFTAAIWSTPALASYDPDFLSQIYGSDPRHGLVNYSGYRSAAFDALAKRVASATDLSQRRAAVREELELLRDEAPAVPLFFAPGVYAYRPQAYDRWVFVKGSGIFDKRSFMEPPPVPEPPQAKPAEPPAAAAVDEPTLSPIGWAAIALVAIGVLVALTALIRGRGRRR